jgi:hypothetical protein
MGQTIRTVGGVCTSCTVMAIVIIGAISAATLIWALMI